MYHQQKENQNKKLENEPTCFMSPVGTFLSVKTGVGNFSNGFTGYI